MFGWIPLFAALVGFAVSSLLGVVLIPFLHKLHFGQTILDIGPKWHKNKQGTPIMGGIMFMVGTVCALVAGFTVACFLPSGSDYVGELQNSYRLTALVGGVLMALCMSAIGFMDDYIKAVKKQNLGLRASQKTLLQLIVAAAYLATLMLGGMNTTYIPFVGSVDIMHGAGLLFWPVALIFIYGFTNAVNLTDGVDGLATSVTFVVSLFYMVVAGVLQYYSYNLLAAGLCGALLGFLIWNAHPAKIFMGDTGSMFLGGIVVAFAFAIERPILLLFAGILYFAEAMSVVIQVAYYKRTKKRLFKMSPIHHHFEMSGWKENKIVIVFSTVALVGCLVAFVLAWFG